MEPFELTGKVAGLFEAEFHRSYFDTVGIHQHFRRDHHPLLVQPVLWALAKHLLGAALQLPPGNVKLFGQPTRFEFRLACEFRPVLDVV